MDSREPERKARIRNMSNSASEICQDLNPGICGPLLECLHLDNNLLQQQNTKKL